MLSRSKYIISYIYYYVLQEEKSGAITVEKIGIEVENEITKVDNTIYYHLQRVLT